MAQQQAKSSRKPEPAETAAPQQQTESLAPPKKRGKLVLLLSLAVVLAAGGGLGFYFMQSAHSDAGAAAPKPPVFVPLETFTVNLLSDPAQMQFMQAGVTLKLDDKGAAELVRDRLPEVRNRVLLVLSSKRGSDLLSVSGKQKLAVELGQAIRMVIAPAPPPVPTAETAAKPSDPAAAPATTAGADETLARPNVEVLFTSFIIQ
jgi:flagellar FliL protein